MSEVKNLTRELKKIKDIAYDNCSLLISDFVKEPESEEYKACKFKLNGRNIICRTGKVTPKKIGQFVTCWRRNKKGITESYNENDPIDFYLINVNKENRIGQFVFPKSVLLDKGIMSTVQKEGKRGFRVYPVWDLANNKQAAKTQKWQLNYFVEYDSKTDLKFVKKLFETK